MICGIGRHTILRAVVVVVCLAFGWGLALAGGPLYLNSNDPNGVERWPNGGRNIPYNPDGPPAGGENDFALGYIRYSQALTEVEDAFTLWQSVPSSSATYHNAGPMPFDIDVTNYFPFVENLFSEKNEADGYSPIVFDQDGAIFSELFGFASILGFASVDTRDDEGNPLEGVAFLNGRALLSGLDINDFRWVFVHEFGHYSGLAHSVVNGQNLTQRDTSGPTPYNTFERSPRSMLETMYPFIVRGGPAGSLHRDDIAFFSFLYPAKDYFSTTGTIKGEILDPNGVPLTGVNVIARNIDNPFEDAVSAISGDRGEPGEYTIHGLKPDANYVVYTDEILLGGFSTPFIPLLWPEEFYSGSAESNNITSLDPPDEATPVTAIAGTELSSIDIIFNLPAPGQPLYFTDNDSIEVELPFTFTFCGETYESFHINSNGNITFGAGDVRLTSVADHLFGLPRIAGLWKDFNTVLGGSIMFDESGGEIEVIFNNLLANRGLETASFSITLSDKLSSRGGNIFRIEHQASESYNGLVGFSCGEPVAASVEPAIDLSSLDQPIRADGSVALYEVYSPDNALDLSGLVLEFDGTPSFSDAFEPNNSLAEARLIELPFSTEAPDNFSELGPNMGDIDWYVFDVPALSTLVIDVPVGYLGSRLGLFRVQRDDREQPLEVQLVAEYTDNGEDPWPSLRLPIEAEGEYALAFTTSDDLEFAGEGETGGRYALKLEIIKGLLLSLGGNSFEEVDIGFAFPFQGKFWTSVFVSANGYLTFGEGSTDFSETVEEHLYGPPRIAALYCNLSPDRGGFITTMQDGESFVVRFIDVPEFPWYIPNNSNSFTITLYPSGSVSIDYGHIDSRLSLVGISGARNSVDPGPTDLSDSYTLSTWGSSYELFDIFNGFFDLSGLRLVFGNPDVNLDGSVDSKDLMMVRNYMGQSVREGGIRAAEVDINLNERVDRGDFELVATTGSETDFVPGDIDLNGCTDEADLNQVLQFFDSPIQIGVQHSIVVDLNADGLIDKADSDIIIQHWGLGCINQPNDPISIP